MIPLKDHNPRSTPPVVTVVIILANVVAFYSEIRYGFDPVITRFGAVPSDILHGLRLETLFTSMFLHGGFMHIAGNMLYLWIFGDNIEHYLGHSRFLVFYLLCGLLATLGHILLGGASHVPMVGASGAISGVLGAYLVKYPKAKVVVLIPIIWFLTVRTIPAFFVLGFWFLLQLLYGLGSLDTQGGGVAFWAHVGGFAAGMALVLVFPTRRRSK
ncbi:MAG: rhomboid family intramembrane serine protease [Calditrichaeota bacterium]|nr:rhomboid family intramembrane serine protease [Calditrichota bacterium]